MHSISRHPRCRYCRRYNAACGRPHTEATDSDWGRTWDGFLPPEPFGDRAQPPQP